MTIRYISTRGQSAPLQFEEVVLAGLAPDGGLYVPETLPHFSTAEIAGFSGMSYTELAVSIMWPFVEGSIARNDFIRLVSESYSEFRHSAVAPLTQLGEHSFLLELFHGPTLAFKDFALQFLGRLLGKLLQKNHHHAVVIGATSGDTGSAAIAGLQGRANMDVVILHPYGRVSDVQRKQMTTMLDKNVHNIAIDGTFDDCQDIVKSLFADATFRDKHHLTAVNSINWARILAQVVYYFYAALKLGSPARAVNFSVPTGNFGDIYAGYVAKNMGLPIEQLIIATNRNDILTRCLATGNYGMQAVTPTISPSMDIQISSNFERLLFDLYGRDGAMIASLMNDFRRDRSMTLSPAAHRTLTTHFSACAISEEETKATIRDTYATTGQLLDPHSAVGLAAGLRSHNNSQPLVALATAHPAKFPDAIQAASGIHPTLPPHLADLLTREERFTRLANDVSAVKTYIEKL